MFAWCDTQHRDFTQMCELYHDCLTQHHMTGWYSSILITPRNLSSVSIPAIHFLAHTKLRPQNASIRFTMLVCLTTHNSGTDKWTELLKSVNTFL
jgi:hypothetical protein